MKNLTKIFMAVVAGMFAFSCVTDTTDDLGVNIQGGEKVTEVTLSMEAARTHLGEKVDGKYPLYWSEGDAISINGVASNPLEGVSEAATAVFKFSESVTTPLCVVYPAAAAQAAEEVVEPTTVYPVNFLATQPYTVDTFAPQAAPMYGYAAELPEGGIQMQHLTGVLRFAISGNGEKVTNIAVRAQNGKIAGAFTIDCANGTLTAVEASNTVNVTFAEPLVLGEEATPVYVTVPAGSYGTFVITITTEAHEKMTLKFNSDVKPITAATVREFKPFVYEANTNDSEDVFIIDSEEKLIEFAKIASVFYPRTSAKVTATLDMSGYDWKPIENFGAYTFDGGSEEACEIQGLNAPLFGSTAATIQNLTLTGVDITVNDIAKLGAIACTINGGSLNNCSASGKIEINNTKLVPSENTWGIISYGGIVGSLTDATVKDVTNNVNITLNQVCHTDNVAASYISLGGITGYTTAGTHANVANNGALTVNSTTNWIAVGGCYGYGADNVTGATNSANITFAKVEDTTVTAIYVGGVYGAAQALSKVNYTVKDLSNTGDIKIYKDATGASYVGGVIGRNGSGTDCSVDIDGATNLGNVDVNCTFGDSFFGGITGRSYGGATINNVVNGDSTKVDATSFTVNGTCTGTLQFGGCIGDNKCTVTSMYNYSKVVVNGAINTLSIGGCINYSSGTLNGVYNYGTVEINGNSTSGTLYVGGVVQKNTKAITNVENHGDITVNGTHTSAVYIAGISYDIDSTMENVTNDSTIKFAGACDGTLYIGGLTAAATGGSTRTNCTNKGEIIVSGTVGNAENTGSDCFIGGFCYRSSGNTETWDNCHNEANIKLSSTANIAGSIRLAGFIANAEYDNTAMTFNGDCSNSGNITIDGATICAYDTSAVASVGGLIASNTKGASLTVNDTLSNSGVITLKNTAFGGNTWIAGCIGRTIHALTNVSNTAAINISNVEFKATAYVSGCLGQVNAKVNLNDISNTGAITLDDKCKYKELYIAGCLAEDSKEGGIFTNISNNAPISVKGGASKFVRLGGVLGWINAATGHSKLYNYENGDLLLELTDCEPESWIRVGGVSVKLQDSHNTTENHGNITVNGVTGVGGLAVAGVVAYPNNYTRTSCVNNSIITIGAKVNNLVVGGLACEDTDSSNYVSCSNSGAINITENCEIAGYAVIGGFVSARNYKEKYVTSSTNSANITFSGTCGGDLSMGGCVGNATLFGYINDFTNTGNITYNGNAGGNINIGGIFGACMATSLTNGTQFRGNIINTGKISATGPCADATTSYVGGIAGNCAIAISNAKCYAEVYGVGYTGTGMITGAAKSDAVALTDCAVGGKITCKQIEGVDANGDPNYVNQTVTLGESSNIDDTSATEWTDYWYNYIYGSNNPASAAEATGVTLLTESPLSPAPEA